MRKLRAHPSRCRRPPPRAPTPQRPRAARPTQPRMQRRARSVVAVGVVAVATRPPPRKPALPRQRRFLRSTPASRRWPEACSVISTTGMSRAATTAATTSGSGPRPNRSRPTGSLHRGGSALDVRARLPPRFAVRSTGANEPGAGAATNRSSIARGTSAGETSAAAMEGAGGSAAAEARVRRAGSVGPARPSSPRSPSARRRARSMGARAR